MQSVDSPSVLILRAVRTRANKVALNMTVPSLLRGMFIATRRCNRSTDYEGSMKKKEKAMNWYVNDVWFCQPQHSLHAFLYLYLQRRAWVVLKPTLQATLWGQSLPKPSGGWILLSRVTTSRCFIRPLTTRWIDIKGPQMVRLMPTINISCALTQIVLSCNVEDSA